MFATTSRRRARPSVLSLGSSLVISAAASYLILLLFGGSSYVPLSLAVAVAAAVYLYRSRRLRRRLQGPHGNGMEETTAPGQMRTNGLLMVGGGIALVVLPLATVFFLPALLFVLYLALALGIAASELLQFAWIARLEAKTRAELYSVTEATLVDGAEALVRTAILVPKDGGD